MNTSPSQIPLVEDAEPLPEGRGPGSDELPDATALMSPEERTAEVVDQQEMVVITNGVSSAKEPKLVTSNLRGDKLNICLLVVLYILQGIPLGLGQAIPLILSKQNVSYKEQAGFSFSIWPFALKLLWAPIVDSIYVAKFGRRKSWLVPVQYLIGITMIFLSLNVDYYMGTGEHGERAPQVPVLTAMFFLLNFLGATQDIAVDGWALTMLKRCNVGYASTCNSVGQTTGVFLGYVFFMALDALQLVTLSQFLFFWAIVYFSVTTLVAVFKHEKKMSEIADLERDDYHEPYLSIFQMYKLLLKIIRLPTMPIFVAFLLTSKMGTSAADAVSGLKLIEKGMPKDKLAMMSIPLIPLQAIFTIMIAPFTTGARPLNVFLYATPARLLVALLFALIVYLTPIMQVGEEQFPLHYYGMVIGVFCVFQSFAYAQFVSMMAFFAQISDPAVGGTYMTLLNTISNLGTNWPNTLALWFVDVVTKKQCQIGAAPHEQNVCDGKEETLQCKAVDGQCVTLVEGFYIEIVICCIIGFLWLTWGWPTIKRLQAIDKEEWRVIEHHKEQKI